VVFKGPVALIMGSEEDGISDVLLRAADELVKIPMKGAIGSLNVSVAAGIAIYEVVRQKS
jgi:23S rRNA (guanosine2251-2'-O)-methyltransferase